MAATSGIHKGHDAVKMVLAGADVTMVCSALLLHGIEHLRVIEKEMREWMERHECSSIEEIKGILSQQRCSHPGAFERVQYMRTLSTYKPEWAHTQDTSYYFG